MNCLQFFSSEDILTNYKMVMPYKGGNVQFSDFDSVIDSNLCRLLI